MEWNVEYTDEFGEWWNSLTELQQEDVGAAAHYLSKNGVRLGHPQSSQIKGTRFGHLRELRVQSGGRPLRVFYAFDPRRVAILLIGGDKTGDGRFYETYVPRAEALYAEHLEQLKREGLIE